MPKFGKEGTARELPVRATVVGAFPAPVSPRQYSDRKTPRHPTDFDKSIRRVRSGYIMREEKEHMMTSGFVPQGTLTHEATGGMRSKPAPPGSKESKMKKRILKATYEFGVRLNGCDYYQAASVNSRAGTKSDMYGSWMRTRQYIPLDLDGNVGFPDWAKFIREKLGVTEQCVNDNTLKEVWACGEKLQGFDGVIDEGQDKIDFVKFALFLYNPTRAFMKDDGDGSIKGITHYDDKGFPVMPKSPSMPNFDTCGRPLSGEIGLTKTGDYA